MSYLRFFEGAPCARDVRAEVGVGVGVEVEAQAAGVGGSREQRQSSAARRVFSSLSNMYTRDPSRQVASLKNICAVTGKDDFITSENVISDPESGVRVSTLGALDVILQECEVRQPSVSDDGQMLRDVETAFGLPTSEILLVPEAVRGAMDGAAGETVDCQTKFGFDPAAEILKNCCAAHTVMHSVLRSSLLLLRDKVEVWGSGSLERDGQEISLCSAVEVLGQVCSVLEEAKKATSSFGGGHGLPSAQTKSSCAGCMKKTCRAGIVDPFCRVTDASHEEDARLEQTRSGGQPVVPRVFLTRGGHGSNSKRGFDAEDFMMLDPGKCPATSAPSAGYATLVMLANEEVRRRLKHARLESGVDFAMCRLHLPVVEDVVCAEGGDGQKTEAALSLVAATKSPTPRLSPLPAPISPIGGEGDPSPVKAVDGDNVTSGDHLLAPTLEQVEEFAPLTRLTESEGRAPGSEWIRERDRANKESISNFASRGSGINTGKYRDFNTLL
uniref:Wsv131-like protein n=1 Tax=Sicyonia whispovirus TaxID=2984283 RepID=A0A9C7CG21_9VIRU|nr:MAG: wsv131-like protein [Sicyonia whispovirus]